MKIRNGCGLLLLGAAVCAPTRADPLVVEHSGYSSPEYWDWEVHDNAAYITIKKPSVPGTPYDFDCRDSLTGEPAIIGSLQAAPHLGNLVVRVSPHDGRPYGASDVWLLQIEQEDGATATLEDFQIGGNYGSATAGGTLRTNRAGTISIPGNLQVPPTVDKAIEIPEYVSGSVTIGGSILSPVALGVVWGPFTVNGQIAAELSWTWNGDDVDLKYTGTHPGEISIFSAGAGHTVECYGYPSELTIETIEEHGLVQLDAGAGRISVVQDGEVGRLAGTLLVTGDVDSLDLLMVAESGVVNVSGNVLNGNLQYSYGDVYLEDLTGTLASKSILQGRLAIDTLCGVLALQGNATGSSVTITNLDGTVKVGRRDGSIIPYTGLMNIENMAGDILLDNGLAGATPAIQIQTKTHDALVVVNNDGYNEGLDCWNGIVQVGTKQYSAEYRPVNLWLASCRVSDTNGDGTVNGYDIDPFVQLLTDPAGYCAAFPGLCGEGYDADPEIFAQHGSAVYRGDANCDGRLNGYDIDPFVLKLTNPNQWSQQYDCETCVPCGGLLELGSGSGEGSSAEGVEGESAPPSPEDVAALLASSVAPERLPALLEMVEMLAADLPDPERAEFWAEVAAELSAE